MLNLFKLPFLGQKTQVKNHDSSRDVAVGVLKNFIRQRKNISGEELEKACDVAEREMEALRDRLNGPAAPDVDGYDLMVQYLRKMDDDLD